MIEIIIFGRGGQGAVTAAQIMAIAAFYEKKESQAFPNFGVERRGAPVEAFCRIDNKKINIRSQIYKADYAIVLDASLLKTIDITRLKKGGAIVVNTNKRPEELGISKKFIVHAVDATSIAIEVFGKDIVNTMIVAGFAGFTGYKIITKESIQKAIDERFKGDMAKKNKDAVARICEAVKVCI